MSEIRTSGPLLFSEPNNPTRVGEIINTLNEIYDIPMPRLGMSVYVKDEGVNYTITKLEPKLIDGVLVPDAKVAGYELQIGIRKSIVWGSSSNINDYVVAGVYNITGERLNVNDGLPIANSNPGHTISARLVVLDSSIKGTGDSQGKCITQVLTLSNRTGEDGNMYIRTGHGGNINSLSWEPWATLQTNTNVGQVDNLDNLKDNGIYSGVWTKGYYNNYPLTFVCVVINDYFVGVEPRIISQFVYGLSKFDGTVVYQTRVWDDLKNAWSDWEILNRKEISSMISDEIKKVTDGVDPEKLDSLKDLIAWVDTHGSEAAAMVAQINQLNETTEELSDALTKKGTALDEADELIKTSAARYNGAAFSADGDKVRLRMTSLKNAEAAAELLAATTEKAGVMSAEDKKGFVGLIGSNAVITIPTSASRDTTYIDRDGRILTTTAPRSVCKFKIDEGMTYTLTVPMTGNSYSCVYGYSNTAELSGSVEALYDYEGVGDEKRQEITIDTTGKAYPYIAVCYTTEEGVPTLTTTQSEQGRVNKLEDNVTNINNQISELTGTKSTDIELINYPARINGEDIESSYFKGYEVGLTQYRENHDAIYFRGANFAITSNIVRGIIYDDYGNIESYIDNTSHNSNGWEELEITPKSNKLRATYCVNTKGGEIWEPEYVKINGIIDRIDKQLKDVTDKIGKIDTSVRINLPSDIYILNGRISQLFYRAIVRAVNPYIYDIKIMSNIGKTFPRYYEINARATGDYPLTLQVRDNNLNVLAEATTTIHIINAPASVEDKNILCIGASATATGHWPAELQRMLNDGTSPVGLGYGISFYGRKYGAQDSSVKLEATGGWTWKQFIQASTKAIRFYVSSTNGELGIGDILTFDSNSYTVAEINLTEGVGNIRCRGVNDYTAPVTPSSLSGVMTSQKNTTLNISSWEEEEYSPFFNNETGKIDFKTYANSYCDGNIDIIICHLGVNSAILEGTDLASTIANIESFINGFAADFPNGKVLLSAIPMPDDGINVIANSNNVNNANRFGTLSTFMDYNSALRDIANAHDNVICAPSDVFFDTDYGYPKNEKDVNSRISSHKEMVGTNGIHPIPTGSYMIADGILPTLITLL